MASPQPAPPPDEETRRAELDSMKRRATGLLVLATVVYFVTRFLESRYPWLGFLRAMRTMASFNSS